MPVSSFCRKTTMVKHQRRSHQRGLHPNEMLDDCTSESDGGESPPTPTQSTMSWPGHGHLASHPSLAHAHSMHRAASLNDFGQHINYAMASRHGDGHDFHGAHGAPGQHGMHMIQRTASMPQHYYVIEQNNPGIATMNTTGVQQPYHVPRQHVERAAVEIPYSAGSMTSMSNSPSSFSPASGQSPSIPDGLYTHQAQPAPAYAIQEASPMGHHAQQHAQQHPMVQYPPQASSSLPSQAAQAPAQGPAEQYQQTSQPEAWYQYQAPVEVATIGQLPPFGSAVYELYGGTKMEYDDATMQLPSSRIETL